MMDRQFSVCTSVVCAAAAWMVVLTLLVVTTVTRDMVLATWTLASSAVAATASVRACLTQQTAAQREAFELGRDTKVHQMR